MRSKPFKPVRSAARIDNTPKPLRCERLYAGMLGQMSYSLNTPRIEVPGQQYRREKYPSRECADGWPVIVGGYVR